MIVVVVRDGCGLVPTAVASLPGHCHQSLEGDLKVARERNKPKISRYAVARYSPTSLKGTLEKIKYITLRPS